MLGGGRMGMGGYLDRGKKELGDEPDPKCQPGCRLGSLHHRGPHGGLKGDPWGCLKGDGWEDVPGGERQ